MNTLKIQQELLKFQAKGGQVKYFSTADARTFVTMTGTVGYFMYTADMLVKLDLAQVMGRIDVDDIVCPENLLVGTDEYRVGGTVRKYVSNSDPLKDEVYVATGLLKCFDNPKLWQDYNPLGMIVVTEELYGDGKDIVVGIVMPHKVKEA